MPSQSNRKREREYRKLVQSFNEEGRYKGREEEVASRIVNKQRAQYGETKTARREEREGRSPDRGLPIDSYRHLRIDQILAKAERLSPNDLRSVMRYERQHKNRKTLLAMLKQRLH